MLLHVINISMFWKMLVWNDELMWYTFCIYTPPCDASVHRLSFWTTIWHVTMTSITSNLHARLRIISRFSNWLSLRCLQRCRGWTTWLLYNSTLLSLQLKWQLVCKCGFSAEDFFLISSDSSCFIYYPSYFTSQTIYFCTKYFHTSSLDSS